MVPTAQARRRSLRSATRRLADRRLGTWRAATGNDTSSDNVRASIYNVALQSPKSAANVSVGAITVEPSLVGINRPSQILAAISNQGSTDFAALAIHMAVDGRESATPMQIPSLPVGQSVTVRFDHAFTAAGSHWVKIWTDAVDALPADNSAVAAINVWQRFPVLIIDGQLTRAGNFQYAQFLAAAMQPLDPARAQSALIQPTIVSAADSSSANLDDYYAIVINDVAEFRRTSSSGWLITPAPVTAFGSFSGRACAGSSSRASSVRETHDSRNSG